MSLFFKDSGDIYRAEPFAALAWLEHGFGTRSTAAWNGDPRLVTLKQIHSGICLEAGGSAGCPGEGDALTTTASGLLLSIRTADCLPLLIADPVRRAVAAVHAGWRGTVEGVAARTVRAMSERFGSRAADLHVAIGPGIRECCYEVGPEVAARFRGIFPEVESPLRIDLAEANRRLLAAEGVARSRIYDCGLCTHCRPDDFHSWRRDRQTKARMLNVIGIVA